MKQPTNEEIEEFLRESNAIEREYSEGALEDSKQAWVMACVCARDFIDIDYILAVHRRVMKRIKPWIAGKIRKVPVYVGNSIGFKECLKPELVKDELERLVLVWANSRDNMKDMSDKRKEDFVKSWHVAFEGIHPFEDGNGRTGRILMNIQRLSLGLPLLIIREGIEQCNYYKWFKENEKQKDKFK